MNEVLNADVIAKIRHCVNTGLVLGTEALKGAGYIYVEGLEIPENVSGPFFQDTRYSYLARRLNFIIPT
jgi:hypothetical protein